ncbi:MAG: hypothetical protein M3478_14610 [Planctomycetota bacterium]|nr:hypothetical protein [Planctomycetota bacterium]
MRYPLLSLAFVAVIAVGGAQTLGQGMVAEPYPRVFASASGRFGLKVLPGPGVRQPATAIAFTLAADGSETVLWRRAMLNLPADIALFEQGDQLFVVTLDRWGSGGGDHAMVVYGAGGAVLQDLHSDTLRPATVAPPGTPPAAGAAPPSARTRIRDGGQPWRTGVTLQVVPSEQGARVELRWPDGEIASVPLSAGPVKPAAARNPNLGRKQAGR